MFNSFLQYISSKTRLALFLRKIVEFDFQKQKKIIRAHFLCFHGEKILDLGCGTGEFSKMYPKEVYIGLDIDPLLITYAKKKYDKEFIVGDAALLPFQDNSFQKILVVGVFHHLTDQNVKLAIQEIKRVLVSRGELLIMEDTKSNRTLTKILHFLDRGEFIRAREDWKKIFESAFRIKENFTFQSGLSFYTAMIMENTK